MSVAEFPLPDEQTGQPDRTPPNDSAAEQSVLGAMLLSKDAIADVVELVRQPIQRDEVRAAVCYTSTPTQTAVVD